MDRRALNGPSETDEADWQARSCVQKEPKTRFVLRTLIIGLGLAFLDVALDSRDEEEPCNDIADTNRDEAQTNLNSTESPLLIHQSEGLNEHEDEGVGKAREERKNQDNRLGKEHLEGADPGDEDLLSREAVSEWDKLVRTPNVLARLLAALLGDAVHQDGGSSLGNSEAVNKLDESTQNELDPD